MRSYLQFLTIASLKNALILFVSAVISLTVAATAHAVPTIVNPGFESPVGAHVEQSGSFTEGSWTFTAGVNTPWVGRTLDVDPIWTFTHNILEGSQAALIQGDSSISQSGIVFDGATYTLSLLAQGQRFFGGDVAGQPLSVTVGSTTLTWASLATLTPPDTIFDSPPATFTLYTSDPFTVAAGPHTLTLSGTIPFGAIDKTTYIDNLSFNAVNEPVPEPGTFVLAALGLAGLGLLAWKKRKIAVY